MTPTPQAELGISWLASEQAYKKRVLNRRPPELPFQGSTTNTVIKIQTAAVAKIS